MSAPTGFELQSVQLSLRFIQGYRYLDRCGECLIRLEESLDEGWIPVETSPTSGSIKHEPLGMGVNFNSEGMNVRQSEYLLFESFKDQSCKAYETLWRALGIDRINTPALRLWYQKGFDENQEDEAEQHLLRMGLCQTDEQLLRAMGGQHAALQLTVVTQQDALLNDSPVEWRRRLQANVVKQVRQQNFDARFLQRSRALGNRQGDAIRAMQTLRKRHPDLAPVAVQLEIEASLDMELSTKEFNMPDFIVQSKEWADKLMDSVVRLHRS
jgi:hypothetical protein